MMSVLLFLGFRALHVLLAATWIGSTIFISMLLTPAVDASGSSGGLVMMNIDRRGITAYMGVLGGMTIVTGLYLLWHFAGGFGAITATHAGIAFGIGGTSGILAGIVGGGVVGRSGVRMANLMREAAGLPEGPAKAQLIGQSVPLRHRMKIGSRAVIALQLVALVLMAVGHYV
jgi:ABC-type transport system involved in multi-copper enzyme maturation permease subunit